MEWAVEPGTSRSSVEDDPGATSGTAAAVRAPRGVAVARAGIALLAVLAVAPLAAFAIDGTGGFDGFVARLHLFSYVAAASFGLVGVVIARRQPTNALAVRAVGIAAAFAAGAVLDRYASMGHPRDWPGVEAALWVAQWVWVPAMWSIPVVVGLRFPTGAPPARWRVVERAAFAGIAVLTIGWALTPYGVLDVDPAVPAANPFATDVGVHLARAGGALALAGVIASLVALGRRTATSRGVERAQLLWLLLGTSVAVASVAVAVVVGSPVVSSLGIATLPAALAVAVVRHRLWDVKLIIRRSLVYLLLTLAVLSVYALTVVLLGDLLGGAVGAPLVATGLVAIGVQPARDRLQRAVNRLVYGEREDPYAALDRLGSQLDAAVDRAGLLAGVTEAVVRTMRLGGAAIVVDGAVAARVGEAGPATETVELAVRGVPVGALEVIVAPGDELTVADRRLLAELARHVAAAVQAEQLQAQVEASRARLVAAREEERRRIRRDLHDELGPTLAAIAMEVEQAGLDLGTHPDAAARRLDDVAERIRATVRSVRALVEGLRPPALDELHLDGAVRELVRDLGGGTVEVDLQLEGDLADLPAAVDVAAYRIVGEALTNTLRHSGARRATVALRRTAASVEVLVDDDGVGPGAGAGGDQARRGLGLRSMAERAEELGGRLSVEARPGGGTRVRAHVPITAP